MSSIISSIVSFSTHSTRSVAPARAGLFSWQAVMDSLLAIGTGLVLRVFVSIVTNEDNRAASTLIGLWEGIVLMHFLKKMPRSYDPYVAYGVRLFVDLLVTESLYRLMVVLLWTGLGMVLADITPIFWYDMGMRKMWHRFRRDLYIMSRSIRSFLPFAAKPRSSRVRFHERTRSASRGYAPTESVVTHTSAPTISRSTTTTTTSRSAASSATPVIPTLRPQTPARPRRPVPGSYPASTSEFDADSVAGHTPPTPSNRSASSSTVGDDASDALATPRIGSSYSHFRIHDPPLGSNVSSSSSTVSDDTEVPQLVHVNPADLPDIDLLQQDTTVAPTQQPVKKDETPRPPPIVLPPTPADTLRDIDVLRANETSEKPPPSATMPVIPDQNDGNFGDGWETIDRSEAPPILLHDEQQDRKGKGRERSSSPSPDRGEISMPVPHPAPPPILPVLEPHSDATRQDSLTPPPSFDDIYGPDANDIAPPTVVPPADVKSRSLIDFTGDNGEAGQGDPGGTTDNHGDVEQHPTPDQPPDAANTSSNDNSGDGTTLAVDSSSPPYEQVESQGTNDQPDTHAAEPPPPSPSPPPSPVLSSAPPLDARIPEAFTLRQRVMSLSQEFKDLQQAQTQAGNDGDMAGAVAHKVDAEKKKRELERAKKRLARRIFEDNNAEATNEINLQSPSLTPEEAVIFVEETLERLLLNLDHHYTELIVILPGGKKGNPVKTHVITTLTDHQIEHKLDPKNGRRLIIHLPSEPSEADADAEADAW